ncbi:MAG: DNA N-6-adenine-methyltransferase [Thermodesulfobacteriota bacterium]|nr:DNA N-6-adenine-methyltransferase [Thermodesulfobacteriota bacterium]
MSAGRTVNSQSQSWGTPQKYITSIKNFFGGSIALDPCSNEYSIVHAETEFMLPEHDGLREDWNYPTIYMNPPYGADRERGTTIKNWLGKCFLTHKKYNSEILALVPVATNTAHWKNSVFGQAKAVCFLYDTRLKFLENGSGAGKGAPMACAMIYWGENYDKFYDIFIHHGAVIDISNLQGEEIGATRNQLKLFAFE